MDFVIESSKVDTYRNLGKKWLQQSLDIAAVEYSESGISANIDEWLSNKSSLIGMFSKSPYWNEETLSVIKPVSYTPETNIDDAINLFNRLFNCAFDIIGQNGEKDAKTAMKLLRMAQAGDLSYPRLSIHKERIETPEEFAFFKEVLEYPGINVGMKWSRLIQAIFKKIDTNIIKDPTFAEKYTRWTEGISSRPATYTLSISLNPADYILMSYGNSWSSCHIINPSIAKGSGDYNGIHKAGTLDYMSDNSAVMVQTLDNRTKPEDLPVTTRVHRNVFFVKPEIPAIVQSRLYPNNNEAQVKGLLGAEVRSVLSEIYGGNGLWRPSDMSRIIKKGDKHYPDYQSYGSTSMHFVPEGQKAPVTHETRFESGNVVHCLSCGKVYSGNPGMLTCGRCAEGRGDCSYVTCHCCGEDVAEDEARTVNGEYYCDSCFDNDYTYCTNCDQVISFDYSYEGADGCSYCESCYDNLFCSCNACSNAVWNDDAVCVNGEYYCGDCADEISFCCNRCGERTLHDDGHELNDNEYCSDCFEEISFCCDDCGEFFHNDDVRSIGDKQYCDDCYEKLPECKDCGDKLLEECVRHVEEDTYCESCFDELQDEENSGGEK